MDTVHESSENYEFITSKNKLICESPHHDLALIEHSKIRDLRQKFTSAAPATLPSKRSYLHSMTPNVPNKAIYLQSSRHSGIVEYDLPSKNSTGLMQDNFEPFMLNSIFAGIPKTDQASKSVPPTCRPNDSPEVKKRRFERPMLVSKAAPTLGPRSKSTVAPRSRNTLEFDDSGPSIPPSKLRRTTSMLNELLTTNNVSSSDRFIPSRHNSTLGKLTTRASNPLPNASPETHIEAQTSKIYQHHVAEACGLEMGSRVLLYQPAPPARKSSVNLFSHLSANSSISSLSSLSGLNNIMGKSLSPVAAAARAKKIPTGPDRVLDAPALVDDFYLNLLAWSLTNLLAIGLEDAVYVWNASTGSVGLLCELPNRSIATSLRWSDDGSYISIGKDDGHIEIWDIETNTKLRTLNCDNHQSRVALSAWNRHILTTSSRAGTIYNSDVRLPSHVTSKFEGAHSAEVCGLEYNKSGQQLASGGNDNLVCIWDIRQSTQGIDKALPLFTKTSHTAAVKALSWCPYQSNLLASGGGSNDKSINFWNTISGARVNTIETGSQISSLNWGYASGTGMEVVATHGFPTNNISLFNYPTLQKTGLIQNAHDSRILGGCLSPDRLTLATVAGDESLKFWSLFDLYKPRAKASLRDTASDACIEDQKDLPNIMSHDDNKIKMMHIR